MENLNRKILVIEDDSSVCAFINKGLSENNFEVTVALNGRHGYELALSKKFDLIILDIMLPEMNGIEICLEIRKQDKHTPILFLTALGSSENISLGLNSGGDDYLSKPFKFIELTARINSLLRRSSIQQNTSNSEEIYTFLNLTLNNHKKTAQRNGLDLNLTSTEYRLLLTFMKAPQKVFSREELLDKVWGVNYEIGTNVVDVYVNYLRKKTEKKSNSRLLQTVIGMGYVLKENDNSN